MLTHKIRVYGIVQGVGFRPFVSRVCLDNRIMGTVANRGSYVEIFAQGENVPALYEALKHTPPDRAVILNVISKEMDMEPFSSFEIIESEKDSGDIFVSPDIAICEECKKELFDKNNRRYMHPFINCTNCGPRLTILDSMPYDRERTSMKEFPMCPECEYEYTHPETRRYDAQPVCCPNCGPVVYAFDPKIASVEEITTALNDYKNLNKSSSINESASSNESNSINEATSSTESNSSNDSTDKLIIGSSAITAARRSIVEGKIVAIKGIGGFHLCCDAKNEEAVARLRSLKNRPMKPFAVMMKDIETVERECFIPDNENRDSEIMELLTGHQKPIILLERKETATLAESVSPGNPNVGVMLPYTPVHLLLFDYQDEYEVPDCLIMTSANASGAPICRTDEDAINEIADFTDLVLSNNRTIRTRADDTVTDFYNGKPYMIRRSRGFAPLPIMITASEEETKNQTEVQTEISAEISAEINTANSTKSVLAIGGELKNTFCIAKDNLLYPSAYVGDMADIRTVNALEESITRMEELLETKPNIVVADLHPKYNTTAVAESLGLPVLKIQHHYAHILSCMAENDYLDEVIGVSFDGTGYGTDGTIWGGEYLRCSTTGFERLGNITPFIQSGGDLSSKEGWRIATSILGDFAGNRNEANDIFEYNQSDDGSNETYKLRAFDKAVITEDLGLCSGIEYDMLSNMARTGINSITSTSAGRLFDAVSAVLGIRRSSTFEGEAATALMFAAKKFAKEKGVLYLNSFMDIPWLTKSFGDTKDLVRYIANEKLNGQPSDKLALLFHMKLAEIIAENVIHFSQETGIKTAALSGGVFQNTLLLEFVDTLLEKQKIRVLRHSLIPPNDGGICVGQALAGLAHLAKEGHDN